MNSSITLKEFPDENETQNTTDTWHEIFDVYSWQHGDAPKA